MVVATLVTGMGMLIWNGSSFVRRLSIAEGQFSLSIKVAAVALCLNVALILFGWRRYADLQHETERRIEDEVRAEIIASTDGMTGLLNRKGLARRARALLPLRSRAVRSSRSSRSSSTASRRSMTASAMTLAMPCFGACRTHSRVMFRPTRHWPVWAAASSRCWCR
jgi:hypothetical protein